MRTMQWMLGLSVLMFVTSIWFILAAASQPAAASGSAIEPIATVRQVMLGIVAPASSTVYQSVSIIVSEEGVQENYPRSEEEWDQVAASAAAIAEAGGLLMAEGRSREGSWQEISQAMIDASLISMQAALDRDKEALLNSGEALNASCDNCHRAYNIGE